MHSVNVSVPSSEGLSMAGTIDFPDDKPIAWAMFAHCFTGSRHTPAASRVCRELTNFGIASLRFDFPGLGQSEGDFGSTSFSSNVEDIKAAHRWMSENYGTPQLLIGHSLGGAASLRAATELKALSAVATIGAPFDPAHAVLHFADRIKEVDDEGSVTVVLGGRDIVISREFLEDLAEVSVESYLPRLRKPLLLLHSPTDQTVGIDNAQNIFRITRYPKSLVSLDRADHLCTRQGSAQRAAQLIGSWVAPYLKPEYQPEPLEAGAVATSATGTKFADVVRTRHGNLLTDRSKSDGGKNLGHSVSDLVAGALAAHGSQAIRALARKKKIRLDAVSVRVHPREDGGFERSIEISGDIDEATRRELIASIPEMELSVDDRHA
ncbi:alpha/beta fold hydrolase [Corynebacterium uropygiale]|uniref:Alpha/beta fold hydrolase n=1 Tax=Corynebacterium uropygiale TaxID=1775911 RepID=A0A9X1TZB0_9CORY|nr:alpha/beta fold hydrolase [Corynebacterium uropygiale]